MTANLCSAGAARKKAPGAEWLSGQSSNTWADSSSSSNRASPARNLHSTRSPRTGSRTYFAASLCSPAVHALRSACTPPNLLFFLRFLLSPTPPSASNPAPPASFQPLCSLNSHRTRCLRYPPPPSPNPLPPTNPTSPQMGQTLSEPVVDKVCFCAAALSPPRLLLVAALTCPRPNALL